MAVGDLQTQSADERIERVFRFSGRATRSDAISLYFLQVLRARNNPMAFATGALILLVFAALMFVAYVLWKDSKAASLMALVIGTVIFPVLLVIRPIATWVMYGRMEKAGSGIFRDSQSVVSNDGVATTTDSSTSVVAWSHFRGYRANQTVAALYYRDARLVGFLTRGRMQHPDEWADFVALIASKLPRV